MTTHRHPRDRDPGADVVLDRCIRRVLGTRGVCVCVYSNMALSLSLLVYITSIVLLSLLRNLGTLSFTQFLENSEYHLICIMNLLLYWRLQLSFILTKAFVIYVSPFLQ